MPVLLLNMITNPPSKISARPSINQKELGEIKS